ncbi:hypothetical protein AMTRI_Chr02g216670 [Amborella trichopoda]
MGGSIPVSLRQLWALDNPHLSRCGSNSSIPSHLGLCTNLSYLDLGGNNITGCLAASFAALSRISDFSNHLTSFLPPELWNLKDFKTLNLGSNDVTTPPHDPYHTSRRATEPHSQDHKLLHISNSFSGNSPVDLYQNNKHPNVYSSNVLPNQICNKSKSLQNCVSMATSLVEMTYLKFRKLEFYVSRTTDFQNLRWFHVYDNCVTGLIPNSVEEMVNLSGLVHSRNKLLGPIPATFLIDRHFLNLSHNALSGEIPLSLRSFSKFKVIDLSENKLSGSIPSWIRKRIKALRTIPQGISHIYSLQVLDLAFNNLSGTIPTILNNLTVMIRSKTPEDYRVDLDISTGGIEERYFFPIGIFTRFKRWGGSLQYLDLSNNMLSSKIPRGMPPISFLSLLNLSFNNLSGPIPYSGQMIAPS